MANVSFRPTFSKRLQYLFPPPQFLAMPAVGLDVSDSSIKFVEFVQGLRGMRLNRWGKEALPRGTIAGGKIQNMKALTATLTKLRKQHDLTFVHASLPEQQAYFFKTEVPQDIKASRMRQVIEFKLESHVPIALQDAIFDYDLLAPRKGGNHIDVGVTVYPCDAVEKFTAALSQAGLVPLSLEIEAQAIERAVVPTFDEGTHMVIDFGETRTGIAIVHRSMLVFTSTLEVRGRELTQAIMEDLKVGEEEAEHFKNESGIVKNSGSAELSSHLMATVTTLKSEIERHHAYWESRQKDADGHLGAIESVILCGGNANLAGLPEYLTESLQLPAVRANVWRNVFSFDERVPEIDFAHSLSFATAVGLALRALV